MELGEIEETLRRHERVKEAVVTVREYEGGEKRLVGYVVWKKEGESSVGELKEYVRGRLPEYMTPWAVMELESLPVNANGKVDRARRDPRMGQRVEMKLSESAEDSD